MWYIQIARAKTRNYWCMTGAPLDADLEITGTPFLTLEMSSTTGDGALHAYLEDVSSEGRGHLRGRGNLSGDSSERG